MEEAKNASSVESLLPKTKRECPNVLQYIIQHYPPFCFHQGSAAPLLSFITILFSVVSLVWILVLFATMLGIFQFATILDTPSYQYKHVRYIFIAELVFAATDRVICLLYFACKYDNSWDSTNA
eukprot:96534_1